MSLQTESLHLYRALLRQVRQTGQSKGEKSLSKYITAHVRATPIHDAASSVGLGKSYLSLLRAVEEKTKLYADYQWGISVDEKKRVMQSATRVGLSLPEVAEISEANEQEQKL